VKDEVIWKGEIMGWAGCVTYNMVWRVGRHRTRLELSSHDGGLSQALWRR
jgi:hypothetical protein